MSKVQIDLEGLRAFYELCDRPGTLRPWAEIALQWAQGAQEHIEVLHRQLEGVAVLWCEHCGQRRLVIQNSILCQCSTAECDQQAEFGKLAGAAATEQGESDDTRDCEAGNPLDDPPRPGRGPGD